MKKRHSALIQQLLLEARADVVQADQKASVLLAGLGIGFGAVIGGEMAGDFDPGQLPVAGGILWWAGCLTAAGAVWAAAAAVWPRYKLDDAPTHGVSYWGHAAAYEAVADLQKAFRERDHDDFDRHSHQLFRLSKVVLTKYRWIRSAMIAGGAAAALLTAATLLP